MGMSQEEIEAIMTGTDLEDILKTNETYKEKDGLSDDISKEEIEVLDESSQMNNIKYNSKDIYLYKEKLSWVDEVPNNVVVNALLKEPYSTIALVLLLLPKERSYKIFPLLNLDDKYLMEVITRIEKGFTISEDIVYLTIDGLKNSILHLSDIDDEFYNNKFDLITIYDKNMAPYILNRIGDKSDAILQSINSLNPELAYTIKDNMLEFDDIFKVFDNMDLFKIMGHIDTDELAISIYGKDESYKLKLKGAMSQRAAQRFEEEISLLGRAKSEDIEFAQENMKDITKRLLEYGEIERDLDKL